MRQTLDQAGERARSAAEGDGEQGPASSWHVEPAATARRSTADGRRPALVRLRRRASSSPARPSQDWSSIIWSRAWSAPTARRARLSARPTQAERRGVPRLAQGDAAPLAPHAAAVAWLAGGAAGARRRGQGAVAPAGRGPRLLGPGRVREGAGQLDAQPRGLFRARDAMPIPPARAQSAGPSRAAIVCLPRATRASRIASRSTGPRPRACRPDAGERTRGQGRRRLRRRSAKAGAAPAASSRSAAESRRL